MTDEIDTVMDGPDWYISREHATRTIGYLSAVLPALNNVPTSEILDEWTRGLRRTMGGPDEEQPSPVAADALSQDPFRFGKETCGYGCGPVPHVDREQRYGIAPACPTHGWVAPLFDEMKDTVVEYEKGVDGYDRALFAAHVQLSNVLSMVTEALRGRFPEPEPVVEEARFGPPSDDESAYRRGQSDMLLTGREEMEKLRGELFDIRAKAALLTEERDAWKADANAWHKRCLMAQPEQPRDDSGRWKQYE